jgi:RecA/RadA recombinase
MTRAARLSTGVDGLDDLLGGGLVPGTLTVVVGATGIGKTQLGLQFLNAGRVQEGRQGIIFDMSARGDSQAHADYAERMFGNQLVRHTPEPFAPERAFDSARPIGDYLHIFEYSGRRVSRDQVGFDRWHDWQAELASRLEATIDFFYSHFVRGVRRAVIDGIEPVERPSDSIQIELFEYIYHQILRKESTWVARDLFRQAYRSHEQAIERNAYDSSAVGVMLLSTSHEPLLEDLIRRPLDDGDLLATANTLIYMGKLSGGSGQKFERGLYVAKHRASACADEIIRYTIGDKGIHLTR